jgi:hypothetical protein
MNETVWRFGYGSNLGRDTLEKKKNLTLYDYRPGCILGYRLAFEQPGPPFVDPSFASCREAPEQTLYGVAFRITKEQAAGLDQQEAGYDVKGCKFVDIQGEEILNVGLYVPQRSVDRALPQPSLRYLRLMRSGARQAGLSADYIKVLDDTPHYQTSPEIRAVTLRAIDDFLKDPQRASKRMTSAELAEHNGHDSHKPSHTSLLGFVVRVDAMFKSWRGHSVTRRNLLHFRGQSVDVLDIPVTDPTFRPLPRIDDASAEEREFWLQNFDHLIHTGGVIVARLQEFVEEQPEDLRHLLDFS